MKKSKHTAAIPMRFVGPIKIIGGEINEEIKVPLATLETPLWASVNRGAKLSRIAEGINTTIISECMSRSILLEAPDALYAKKIIDNIDKSWKSLEEIANKNSKFTKLKDWHWQVVGNLLYLRFSFTTGDAAGHNMVNKAADNLINWFLATYNKLNYISVSANFCVDKKVSAVNGILGRGKYVVSELLIPKEICKKILHTSPEKIVDINIKKNLIGTNLAGGVRTANAHYANMLLAFYLATGQDAANIVEGSQGITHAEMRGKELYFSVTLPNIIIGSIGCGKNLSYVQENLSLLNCLKKQKIGQNSRRLAIITAATVCCGELSLLAALTNRGELTRTHERMERM